MGLGACPTGNYNVGFSTETDDYISEWYDNKEINSADPIAVTAGRTTSNIDAQLTSAGRISGRVTDASGEGIYNIRISTYDLNFNWKKSEYTDSSGNYLISELPVGNYKVQFSSPYSNYGPEWYDDEISFEAADQVAVIPITTSNINAQLVTGGQISGRVTKSRGGDR